MTRVQRAPDGGWGWVIVFVSFSFHFLMGFIYAMNVLYGAWLDEFDQGRGLTSWVVAIFNTTQVFMGPLSANLAIKYGYKTVTFMGGVLLGIGFFASFFATSIIFLFFTVGIVAGSGAGLCYVPVITVVAVYFEKKRSLAMGIATSGVGVGTFIMPPIMMMLEEEYTWRGVMFLLSGFLLQMCIFSMLMRPLPYTDVEESSCGCESEKEYLVDEQAPSLTDETIVTNNGINEDVVICAIEEVELVDDSEFPDSVVSSSENVTVVNSSKEHSFLSPLVVATQDNCSTSLRNVSTVSRPSPVIGTRRHLFHSDISISSEGRRPSPKRTDKEMKQEHSHINMASELLMRKQYLQDGTDRARSNSMGMSKSKSPSHLTAPQAEPFSSAQELTRPSYLPKVIVPIDRNKEKARAGSGSELSLMLSGSLYNIVALEPHLNSMLSMNSKASENAYFPSTLTVAKGNASNHVSQDFPILEKSETIPAKETACCGGIRVYIELMKNLNFVIFSASNFMINLSYLMPIIYMVDRAVESDVSKSSASFSLSMFGAGNLFSRVATGVLADRRFLSRINFYIIFVFGCGASTCFSVFCGSSPAMHAGYGFLYGCFIGGYVILTPVVLVDLMGVELVAESYGLCLVFMGAAMLIGSPMAGWIYDSTGSYLVSYVVHGLLFILSAMLLIPLAIMSHRNKRNAAKDEMLETPSDLS